MLILAQIHISLEIKFKGQRKEYLKANDLAEVLTKICPKLYVPQK